MGVTPLHLAAQYNRRDVSKVLITHHADIDMLSSHDGSTALYCACGKGFTDIVQDLIAAKASISKTQRSGGFPLLYATMTGHRDIVNLLLLAGANPAQKAPDGLTPLHVASTIGSIPIMKMLLSHLPKSTSENLDVYRWSLLLLLGSDKQSLLHSAVLSNKPKMVKYLLQTAVKFTTDKDSFKDSFSLKYFIDLKIDSDGGSALHYASRKGYSEIVKILLTFGSDVRQEMNIESFCATPLYLAVHSGNQDIVKMLLRYAPDADAELCGKRSI
jgi:ankyrin repeat protein